MNIYEPAALIANSFQTGDGRAIAAQIRALPNPPNQKPALTPDEMRGILLRYTGNGFGKEYSKHLAGAVNELLALPNPPNKVPVFTSKELWSIWESLRYTARDRWQAFADAINTRITAESFTAKSHCTDCDTLSDEIVALRAELAAAAAHTGAAVLAEREACAKLTDEMPDNIFYERPGGRPTSAPISKHSIAHAIRARTTTPEIAGGQPTPAKEDAPASASAAGEGSAPKPAEAKLRTLRLCVHEHGGNLYLHEAAVSYSGVGKPFWIDIAIPQPGETP